MESDAIALAPSQSLRYENVLTELFVSSATQWARSSCGEHRLRDR